MGIVRRIVEGLDELGMPLLYLRKALGLLKVSIRQTELYPELGLDQIFPGLTFLDIANLNVQLLQQTCVCLGGEDRPVVRDDGLWLTVLAQSGLQ
jgi:hypothetical protein